MMATSQQLWQWASAKSEKGAGLLQASPDQRTGKPGKSGEKEEKKGKGKGGRGGKEEAVRSLFSPPGDNEAF